MKIAAPLPNTCIVPVLNALLIAAIALMLVLYLLRRRTRIVTVKLFGYYGR